MSTTSSELRLGVLALQGGFAEHENHLKEATREAPLCHSSPPASEVPYTLHVTQVRNPSDLDGLDGLILPGGESTAMSVFLQQNDFALLKALKLFTASKPTWGTCAGLILLSNNVSGQMKDGQQLVRQGTEPQGTLKIVLIASVVLWLVPPLSSATNLLQHAHMDCQCISLEWV